MNTGANKITSGDRPPYRPAQVIDADEFIRALDTSDPPSMSLALIDGGRCLDAGIVFPRAFPLLRHESQKVRWSALFALQQILYDLGDDAWGGNIWDTLTSLATDDSDESVRHLAVDTLVHSLRIVEEESWNAAKASPGTPRHRVAMQALQNTVEVFRNAHRQFSKE